MNLEQIRNRQSTINERLIQHLQESTQVLDHIIGRDNEKEADNEYPRTDGLLADISYEQDITERLLDKLNKNQRRLAEHTYAPVEPLQCVKISPV